MPLMFSGDLQRAALLGMRAFLSLSVALAVASTLTFVEVPGALAALRVPSGLVRVLSAMLSQFSLLRDTARRLLLARSLRGARRFDIGPDVLASLLVVSAARAERVELALSLRGFDPSGLGDKSALRARDTFPLAIAGLFALAIHAMSVLGS
jgi:energy-coupling factor transporter transmembrane protein EcfT